VGSSGTGKAHFLRFFLEHPEGVGKNGFNLSLAPLISIQHCYAKWRILGASAVFATVMVLSGCNQQSKNEENQASLPKKSQEQIALEAKNECLSTTQQRSQNYDISMSRRKYWDAAAIHRGCAMRLQDSALKALVEDAETKAYKQDIESPLSSRPIKIRAIESFARDYPEKAVVYEKLLIRLYDEDIAIAHANDEKERSRPRIGMTSNQVLSSAWGHPSHINKTTTATGIHEQWVYERGRYLYFENNRLTAMQE
jgi:CRISPR/Cas system-associated endoribonuclease Cas2